LRCNHAIQAIFGYTFMKSALETQFLDELYRKLASNELVLPTMPEMALKIRDIVEDPNSSLANISKLINKDPALAARIVQVANSPAFRSRTPFNSVEAAVMRLGGSIIKNLVTAMVMEQLFQSTTEMTDRKLRTYWRHATDVSELAIAFVSAHPHLQADQAVLAGLIHDIGVLPILTFAEEHPELLADEAVLDSLIKQAHCQVGAKILEAWRFSADMIRVALEHENLQYNSKDKPDYVDLLIVANIQSDHKKGELADLGDLLHIPAFIKMGVVIEEEIIELMPTAYRS
jgi:HD-like signal output (HDOD) protein